MLKRFCSFLRMSLFYTLPTFIVFPDTALGIIVVRRETKRIYGAQGESSSFFDTVGRFFLGMFLLQMQYHLYVVVRTFLRNLILKKADISFSRALQQSENYTLGTRPLIIRIIEKIFRYLENFLLLVNVGFIILLVFKDNAKSLLIFSGGSIVVLALALILNFTIRSIALLIFKPRR